MVRSYKNFGCVKTIVLPVCLNNLTIAEYKERYGIDLKEIFKLKQDKIVLTDMARSSEILLDWGDLEKDTGYEDEAVGISPIVAHSALNYDSGKQDAKWTATSVGGSLQLLVSISKDAELKIENLFIGYQEV